VPNQYWPGPYPVVLPTLSPPLTVRPGDVIVYPTLLPGFVATSNSPTTPPVDALTRVVLTGFVTTDGSTPQVGKMTFRQVLVDSAHDVVVTGAAFEAALSGGRFSIPLPGTDDPATPLPGFLWLATEPSGYQYLFSLPIASAGGTLDLADAPRPAGGGGSTYTDEQARDAVGAALVAGSGIAIVVNDAADTITVSTTLNPFAAAIVLGG
jgi:hypothetical protein